MGGGGQCGGESACVIRPLNQWKVGRSGPDPDGTGDSRLGLQTTESRLPACPDSAPGSALGEVGQVNKG